MQIAIVTPVYPPYRGGMGAVAARDAAELRARGHAVAVLTPRYAGRAQNPEADYLPALFAMGNGAVLPSLLTKLGRHDLAHLHYTFYGADMFVWLWSWLRRRPYVMTYHMQPKTGDWRNVIFKLHRWLIEPWVVRRAQAVFVSSIDYARSIGLRHPQLVELPFGVDEVRFAPGRDDAYRAQLGLPLTSTVFVFVGGLDRAHSFKGVDVLIRAAAALPHTADWRLLIVGDGDLRASLTELARVLGIGDKVVFTGTVSEADLPRVYQAADVHVLPSTSQSEAYGLVTLEAAATGLPSIVSDLPGVRTLVRPGETGLVVAPGLEEELELALKRFLDDPGLAAVWGAQARERILAQHTSSKLAERLLEVYKTVL